MAVYTVLDHDEIAAFIAPFGIGPLVNYEGVTSGIENTNYFITTDQSNFGSEFQTEPLRHYVLTIFESISGRELAFYANLTTSLNLRGLPVPCPLTDSNGQALHTLHNKPALLIPKLEGVHPEQPNAKQCYQIGQTLAKIHRSCVDMGLEHPSIRSLNWLMSSAQTVSNNLEGKDKALLAEEIPRFLSRVEEHSNLPQSIIHGDLFRDNTIYQEDRLVGIIDFNSAGSGYLMMDLAIVVNDWCSNEDGSLQTALVEAVISGYRQVRSLTDDEKQLWNDFLRIAATRFWVSRLLARQPEVSTDSGKLVEHKDPEQYKSILLQRIRNPQQAL